MHEPIAQKTPFFEKRSRKVIFTLAFLLLFSIASYALASFFPGQYTDPPCTPGSAGCYVDVFPDQTSTNGYFLESVSGTATWVPSPSARNLAQVLAVGNLNGGIPVVGNNLLQPDAVNDVIAANFFGNTAIGNDANDNVYLKGYSASGVTPNMRAGFDSAGKFQVTDTAANAWLAVSSGLVKEGDIALAGNKTLLTLNDSAKTAAVAADVSFKYTDTAGNIFLSLAPTTFLYGIGDTSDSHNSTQISLDDATVNKKITVKADKDFVYTNAAGSRFFDVNANTGTYAIGDLDTTGNGTQISINNGSQTITSHGSQDFLNAYRIHNLLDPTASQDAATKNYVDSIATGLVWKTLVQAATTTALPANIYSNGASGVGATLTGSVNGAIGVIDGYAMLLNDRLLVKDEGTPANNGIYIVTTVGSGGAPYVLTRATDMDQTTEFLKGTAAVINGSVNANTAWTEVNTVATVGTSAVSFVQFLNSVYSAGAGLSLSGHTFSLDLAHANEWTAVQTFDSGDFKLKGATSGLLTLNTAGTTTPYTLTFPSAQGGAGTVLQNDGSGNLSWVVAGGGGGSGTVTNIATASGISGGPITTTGTLTNDLITGVSGAQTILGSTTAANTLTIQSDSAANTGNTANPAFNFIGSTLNGTSTAQVFAQLASTVNQTSGTSGYTALKIKVTETAVAGSGTKNLIEALAGLTGATSAFSVDNGGNVTSLGMNMAQGGFSTAVNPGGSYPNLPSGNFFVGGQSNGLFGFTDTKAIFGGSSTVNTRAVFYGSSSLNPSANSTTNVLFGRATINAASAVTYPEFANVTILAPTVTVSAGTVTNAASLYIDDAPTNATNNYALQVGASRVFTVGGAGDVGALTYNSFTLTTGASNSNLFLGTGGGPNTAGGFHVALGTGAGQNMLGGGSAGTTSVGYNALGGVPATGTGSFDTVVGFKAGYNMTGSSNIIVNSATSLSSFGGSGITSGNYNTYIGGAAGTNTSNTVSLSDGQGNITFYSPSSHRVILGGGTTDNGVDQLQVNGSTSTSKLNLTGSVSGTLGVSTAATTSSYNIVFPSAQGGALTVLQNDGSGNLTWVSGGAGTGVTTMANIGSSPNNQGASISGVTLTLQPADATHGGVLTSGTQTIAGVKTFSSDLIIGPDTVTAGVGPAGSGHNNTVFGSGAGALDTSSSSANTWIGHGAGSHDLSGASNTGVGFIALSNNTSGAGNTAIGVNTLQFNTVGQYNTALGLNAGQNVTGSYNLILGANAGGVGTTSGSSNIVLSTNNGTGGGTSFGGDSLTTGSNNLYIGGYTGTNTSNTISVSDGQGNIVFYSPSTHRVIIPAAGTTSAPSDNGALFQIGGSMTASGSVTFSGITAGVACNDATHAVGYNSSGLLVCNSSVSDERLKTNITPLDTLTGLSAIEKLNPVSYNWKDTNLPGTGTTQEQFGFIAQDVNQILPSLVTVNPPTYLTPDVTYGLNYQGLTAISIQAIKELDLKLTKLSSIDPNQGDSLAALIVQFLRDAAVQIRDLTVNTLHINNTVCVDDVCVTKDQFKQILINAGSNGSGNDNGTTTPTVETPPIITPPDTDTGEMSGTSADTPADSSGGVSETTTPPPSLDVLPPTGDTGTESTPDSSSTPPAPTESPAGE